MIANSRTEADGDITVLPVGSVSGGGWQVGELRLLVLILDNANEIL